MTLWGCPASASWNRHSFGAHEEAGAFAGMADVAVTEPLGLHQHRVFVAVDQHVTNGEPVAGGLALRPQLVARAAEEGHVAGAPGDVPGILVHEADHQYFARLVVLDHRRNQAI